MYAEQDVRTLLASRTSSQSHPAAWLNGRCQTLIMGLEKRTVKIVVIVVVILIILGMLFF